MRKTMLIALMTSSLFVSVDSVATINADNVKGSIVFFTNRTDLAEEGLYKRYEAEFKKKYPQVTEVKVIAFADYEGSLRPRMNTADYGDVVFILPSVPAEQYGNFYEPLNDLYKADEIYFADTWTNKGNTYGISSGNAVEGLVYNKKVFSDAGINVPLKTVDELLAAAEKIKSNGQIPFYVNFGAKWPLQSWDKYPIVAEGNENVYEKMLTQDKAFSGKTAYRASLDLLKTLLTKGYTEKDLITNSWEDSKNIFAQNKMGMFYLGNWVIPQLISQGAPSENVGFMPIPSNNEGKLYAQMNHDWAYAVSANSKNKETAKAFVKFLLDDSDFASVAGFIPTLKSKQAELPQLKEYMSYEPTIIQTPVNSSAFIEATNKSKIDFYSGGYIQDLMTAKDYEAALEKLDKRWEKAAQKVNKK